MAVVAAALASALAIAPPAPETRQELSAVARAAALSYCATSASVLFEETPNLAFPERIELTFVRECDEGRTLILYSGTASLPDWQIPLVLEIYSSTPLLPPALQVGAPISGLEGVLGRPDATCNGRLHYVLTESDDTLTIETEKGRIAAMVWTFYSG